MLTDSNDIVDYAMPLMNIERLAKEVHHKCLKKDFKSAREFVTQLVAEARLLQTTLVIMEEQQ